MDSYQKNDPIDPMFGVIHVYLPATTFDKFTFLQILISRERKGKFKTKNFSRVGKSSILERFDFSR